MWQRGIHVRRLNGLPILRAVHALYRSVLPRLRKRQRGVQAQAGRERARQAVPKAATRHTHLLAIRQRRVGGPDQDDFT